MRIVSIVLLASLGLAAQSFAAPPSNPPNAAVVYWQSFAAMPPITEAEGNRIAEVLADPQAELKSDIRGLIDRHGASMHDFVRAGKMPFCDWTLEYEHGPYLLLPQCGKMRDMLRVAIVRARIRAADGNTAGAVDDLLATLAAARHVANGKLFVAYLVGVAMEDQVIVALSSLLPKLKPADLTRLQEGIAKLPPVTKIAECVKQEGVTFSDWFVRKADEEFAKADIRQHKEWLRHLIEVFGIAPPLGPDKKPAIDYTKITPEMFRALVARLRADYADLEGIALMKGKERREKAAKFEAEMQQVKKTPQQNDAERLLSAAALPGLARIFEREETSDLRRGLIGLAIAVQKEGPESLEKLPQPGLDKLEYKKIEEGFELMAKYLESDKSETLRIGPPKKEKKDEKK